RSRHLSLCNTKSKEKNSYLCQSGQWTQAMGWKDGPGCLKAHLADSTQSMAPYSRRLWKWQRLTSMRVRWHLLLGRLESIGPPVEIPEMRMLKRQHARLASTRRRFAPSSRR